MDYNKINKMMEQQLGAVKVLEELLDLDAKQEPATHDVPHSDIDILRAHVERIKKASDTALALAKHYQGLEKKDESKVTNTNQSDPDEAEVHVLEGTLHAAFEEAVKEPPKRTRTRKPTAPKVEPEPEDDDDDDLFS